MPGHKLLYLLTIFTSHLILFLTPGNPWQPLAYWPTLDFQPLALWLSSLATVTLAFPDTQWKLKFQGMPGKAREGQCLALFLM